jgi:hypothetical protein
MSNKNKARLSLNIQLKTNDIKAKKSAQNGHNKGRVVCTLREKTISPAQSPQPGAGKPDVFLAKNAGYL